VGIGTTSPGATLDVNGNIRLNSILYVNANANINMWRQQGVFSTANGGPTAGILFDNDLTKSLDLIVNGSTDAVHISASGYVGIGTLATSAPLSIVGAGGNGTPITTLTAAADANWSWATNALNPYLTAGHEIVYNIGHDISTKNAGYMGFNYSASGSNSNFLDFGFINDGDLMILTSAGNVGIGTTSPGAMLEVNGSVKLTANSGASITFQDGSTQSTAYTGVTCGGDYADSVDVAGDRKRYEPGDVLVLTADGNGDVARSAEPYSTMVAGIYSTRPGTVGRRQLTAKRDSEIPMAMVGIVPTRVSAENGPIHRGDLLVTASLEGYAMKGTDRSRMLGAVIGKAMGTLDSGTGVIEVLVTLQ
jgi:hypothetical protein